MAKVSTNINYHPPKDILGRLIRVGDTVAVPKLYFNTARIVVAKVISLEQNCVWLSRYGKYLHSERLAIIDWEEDDGASSSP